MDNNPSTQDTNTQIPAPVTQNISNPEPVAQPLPASNLPKKRTKPGLIVALILVALAATLGFLFLYGAPKSVSNAYIAKSKPIMTDLVSTINDLNENNISQMRNTTSSYQEAKTVLAKHATDLEATIAKTSKLKDQYAQLKSSRFDTTLAEKNTKAFEQAKAIETKYKASLDLRSRVFVAFGNLPNELDSYAANFYRGGLRVDFITQTQNIADEADDAIIKMKNFKTPSDDDMPLYTDRLDYLDDIKMTFTKFNEYYRTFQYTKIDPEVQGLTQRNIARKEKTSKITDDYLKNSSLAKDIKAFNELAL